MEEMNVKGTNEQLMRTEIIIIKMMENRVKSEKDLNFRILVETLNQFIKRTNKLINRSQSVTSLEFFYPLLQEQIGVYY